MFILKHKDIVVLEVVLHVGRPFEVLSIADYLKGVGYEVGCVVYESSASAFTIEEYLDQAHFRHLSGGDFTIIPPHVIRARLRAISPRLIIGPWFVAKHCPPEIPFFAWCLGPYGGIKDLADDVHILANSQTTKKQLYADERGFGPDREIKSLIAPIDYSLFRQYARPWKDRKHDLIAVSRTGMCGERKNTHLHKEFDNIVSITDEHKLVMDRTTIAKAMGDAKIFIHLSERESGPLVAYEAMNAGCYPLFYGVGSVLEQLGSEEFIIRELNIPQLKKRIQGILSSDFDYKAIMARGQLFDQEIVGPAFVDYIKEKVM